RGTMPALAPAVPGTPVPGEVRFLDYRPREVALEVTSRAPALLVLNDSFYPGWEATVDGHESPIYRANLLFRAIEVPAGRSRVLFTYRPRPWRLGLGLALLGLGLAGAGFALRLPRSPRCG
ncbi:MAG: YfhO family protein, partial [Verrucomicrobiales bacterium]